MTTMNKFSRSYLFRLTISTVHLGPDYMSRAGLSLRDLGMFVKHNKNQLRDYMTTGPAHTEAARQTGTARLM